MKIYLDFDNTVAEDAYPRLGRMNLGAFEVMKKLQDAGHEIVLNTYRANANNGTLEKALEYIDHYVSRYGMRPLDGHTPEKVHPHTWDLSRAKSIGELYIDDIALGIPLKDAAMTPGARVVDWKAVDAQLGEAGFYGAAQ